MEKEQEAPTKPLTEIKQKCARCVKGPNLLKTIVIFACTCVVVQQISASVRKLINRPITTYTHFDFNKTILYPSLTFCREPPYKYNKLLEYGLFLHPRYSSAWSSFNFSGVSLDELWEDITYNEEDYFVQYGLNGWRQNVEVTPTLGFVKGRCFTLSPRILNTQATKSTGYSVTLQHTPEDIVTYTGKDPPGYHIFVHYKHEPYTEVEVYNGGVVDYLYVSTGETIDVKLAVEEYVKLSRDDDLCVYMTNFSTNLCTTQFVWKLVEDEVQCSGPWMESQLPRCSEYRNMRALIASYVRYYQNHNCSVCPRNCRAFMYNAYVTGRVMLFEWDSAKNSWESKSNQDVLQTQVFMHFNAMMVTVHEERYNYDWHLFVSDLGGSIGFLLGLSVIGLTMIFTKAWCSIIKPFLMSCKNPTKEQRTIIDVSAVGKNKLFKNYEWKIKKSFFDLLTFKN